MTDETELEKKAEEWVQYWIAHLNAMARNSTPNIPQYYTEYCLREAYRAGYTDGEAAGARENAQS